MDNEELVRGENFVKLADHVLTHYKVDYCDPDDIKDGDIVYCDTEFLHKWYDALIKHKDLVIITHNSDGAVTTGHTNKPYYDVELKKWIGCFRAWFMQNGKLDESNTFQIPIGFENIRYDKGGHKRRAMDSLDLSIKPTKLMYANFSVCTNVDERQPCKDICIGNELIDFVPHNISIQQFYDTLLDYKYIISPPGNGIDCHRHVEALLADRIPVIKRSTAMNLYKDTSVLFVDDWAELADLPLDDMYEDIKAKSNREMLTQAYWDKRIMDIINK
jgi:hypothetical protein